jgi:hypothetical protein
MSKSKYDWINIQKVYDETGVSCKKLLEIFNMPKSTLDLATSSGRFKTRPQKIVIKIENCLECKTQLIKNKNQTYKKFCNNSCSAKFNNKIRDKAFHKKVKKINCVICYKEAMIKSGTSLANSKCKECKNKTKDLKCKFCSKQLYRKQKLYCSRLCVVKSTNYHKLGKLGGNKSVLSQNRRSKNEIYFNELCQQKFIAVKNNEPMFNGWDADTILINEKIAILWNGIWHYSKVRRQHSLTQVQSRDKIKLEQISNCGFKSYIIKDLGSYNKLFVEQQFEIFCNWMQEHSLSRQA